jgi:hypothetical protein
MGKYLSSGLLKELKGFLDEVANILPFSLVVLDFVAELVVLIFEEVHDR